MELKEGFKQTEVGVIPEEWRVKALTQLCLLQRGFDITEATRKVGTVPVYSSAGLSYFHNKAIVKAPGVVTGRRGLLGKVFYVEEPFWPHDTTLWVKDFRGNDPNYVYHFLKGFRLERFDAATSVPTLNRNTIAGLPIAIPPVPEQRAIAAALSEMDVLLDGLGRLIAKKRDVKQAAMQRLLTGEQRLPGYSGEWEVKRFGELFQFLKTANNPRADLSDLGDVGYIHYGDIHTSASAFLDCDKVALPMIDKSKVAGISFVEDNDLVMVDASEDYTGTGKCVEIRNVRDRKLVAGLHTFLLRGKPSDIADGFKGYLQFIPSLRAAMVRLATGISVYGISKNNVKGVEALLPRPDEQRAIVAVLSDMDAEIEALERRLAKTRDLKQGIRQELLTGRTRLV